MRASPQREKTADRRRVVSRVLGVLLEYAGPVAALAVILTAFLVFVPTFRSPDNFRNISRQMAVVAILAAGQTFVIVAGGIDLSVGSMVALTGVLAALTMKAPWVPPELAVPAGLAVGLLVGALAGCLSGTLSEYAQIPSFVVTLGMMGMAAGAAKLTCGGVSIGDLPDALDWLAAKNLWGSVPSAAVVTLAVVAIGHTVLARTRFGRVVYALGGNREAARLAGVPVRRVMIACFTICGLLAGLAGMVTLSRIGSAQPTAGQGFELWAIAATVIGGTSLMGGEGSIGRAFVGALIMAVLAAGLDHLKLSSHWQQLVIGGMIIVAVIVDRLRRAMRR